MKTGSHSYSKCKPETTSIEMLVSHKSDFQQEVWMTRKQAPPPKNKQTIKINPQQSIQAIPLSKYFTAIYLEEHTFFFLSNSNSTENSYLYLEVCISNLIKAS